MFLSKLNEMSVGPLWLLRDRGEDAAVSNPVPAAVSDIRAQVCANCHQSWLQISTPEARILAISAELISDEVQLRLMHNCLAAAGWNQQFSLFSLHGHCQENAEIGLHALKAQVAEQNPVAIIVFGSTAAQLINGAFGQIANELWQFENITLLVTHHPAEMIATPGLKAQVWIDLCLLTQTLAKSH